MMTVFVAAAISTAAQSQPQTIPRDVLLRESARVRAALASKSPTSPVKFQRYSEQNATELELTENLFELLVAAFSLRALDPVSGPFAPPRAADGITKTQLAAGLAQLDGAVRWIEARLIQLRERLSRRWESRLAIEEIQLEASREFWREERERLILRASRPR